MNEKEGGNGNGKDMDAKESKGKESKRQERKGKGTLKRGSLSETHLDYNFTRLPVAQDGKRSEGGPG